MLKLALNDRVYLLEFRHVTKTGNRAQLHRGSVKAVTTCVIVCQKIPQPAFFPPGGEIEFIAIDNALCSDSDNFWRREGRKRSLRECLQHCGALKGVREQLWQAWLEKDPAPDRIYRVKPFVVNTTTSNFTVGPVIRNYAYRIVESLEKDYREQIDPPAKLNPTPEQIEVYKAAGEAKRLERAKARGAT